jgi:hypothetical protein
VPDWTATAGGVYRQPLFGDTTGFLSVDYSYNGDSLSLLNGGSGLKATRPSYSLVDARVGMDWGTSELAVSVRNLTNAKPNLGDIGYVGYAQYDANGTIIPQVATLPPTTVIVQYTKSF